MSLQGVRCHDNVDNTDLQDVESVPEKLLHAMLIWCMKAAVLRTFLPRIPFCIRCLPDECLLKLLVLELCYCWLNTSCGCCNVSCSHLTHIWSSPLVSSAFLSWQKLQLEQSLEKNISNKTIQILFLCQANKLPFEQLLKWLHRSSPLSIDTVACFHSPHACCVCDEQCCAMSGVWA